MYCCFNVPMATKGCGWRGRLLYTMMFSYFVGTASTTTTAMATTTMARIIIIFILVVSLAPITPSGDVVVDAGIATAFLTRFFSSTLDKCTVFVLGVVGAIGCAVKVANVLLYPCFLGYTAPAASRR